MWGLFYTQSKQKGFLTALFENCKPLTTVLTVQNITPFSWGH